MKHILLILLSLFVGFSNSIFANENIKLNSRKLTTFQEETENNLRRHLVDDFTGIYKYQATVDSDKTSIISDAELNRVKRLILSKVYTHAGSYRVDTRNAHFIEKASFKEALIEFNDQIMEPLSAEEQEMKKRALKCIKLFNVSSPKVFIGSVGEEKGESFIAFVHKNGKVYLVEWHYET